MKILIKLYLCLHGTKIGKDQFGNQYYEVKKHYDYLGRARRMCLYKRKPEGSKIPSNWHLWMHHQISSTEALSAKMPLYSWREKHRHSLTGTILRFLPANHIQRHANTERAEAQLSAYELIKPYKPWNPK